MIGRKLSHFRILDRIGAGGMGVVYRAEDERLKRVVALKTLTPERLANQERKLRFLREARTAAAATHPAIATIHEIDEADGVVFIAMELVDGKTLRATIGGRPLGLRETLHLGVEIAEGLAAAHHAHVIHRDLKPDNIIITPDGHVKILDFGLAKLLGEDAPRDPEKVAEVETVSGDLTGALGVLGTPAYMSPEQARGAVADARSDLFSLGIVLYEMATGRQPFKGANSLDTLTEILREQPVSPMQINPDVPLELERIIGKCLKKAPADRYQDTRELVLDLRQLARAIESPPLRKDGPARRTGSVVAVLVGLAGLALVVWGLFHRGSREVETASSFQSMKITRLASIRSLRSAALSPDGRFLGYVALKEKGFGLWVRQISTGSDIEILPPQETSPSGLTFSPDGEYLYYVGQDPDNAIFGALHQVPALGGNPRKVLSDIDSPAVFSPGGQTIAFLRGNAPAREIALILASDDGMSERKLAVRKFAGGFVASDRGSTLAWSPEGRSVAAVVSSPEGGGLYEIVVIGVADGKESRLGSSRWSSVVGLASLPDGSGFALTGSPAGDATDQVWLVSYPDGKVSRITNDVNEYAGVSFSADSGTLATVQKHAPSLDVWAAPAEDPSEAKPITSGAAGGNGLPAIACFPSGEIVFTARGPDGVRQVWSVAPDGTRRRRLTPDGMESFAPLVARSTSTMVFTGHGPDRVDHVFRMGLDGGAPAQLTDGGGETARALSPDGEWLVFTRTGEDDRWWKVGLDGVEPTMLQASGTGRWSPSCSPDGQSLWLFTFRGEGAAIRLGLERLTSEGGQTLEWLEWPPECDPALRHGWLPSGNALVCIGMVDGVLNLWSQPLGGRSAKPLTRFKSGHVFDFDWSTDGKQLVMTRGDLTTDVVLISNFK